MNKNNHTTKNIIGTILTIVEIVFGCYVVSVCCDTVDADYKEYVKTSMAKRFNSMDQNGVLHPNMRLDQAKMLPETFQCYINEDGKAIKFGGDITVEEL